VAAAGLIAGGEPVWRMDDAHWEALFEVNVGAVRQLARVAIPAMMRHPAPRHGRFVAVASAAGHRGLRGLAAYCAAKHACVGFVRGLAADLAGTGVTANVVSPGSTETVMLGRTAELYQMEGPHLFAAQALLERLLTPDEIAAAVEWLCSPESSALTGSVLSADGGLTT
jgi:SDR family mycofactocin-dependent oxidoreductase